MGCSTPDADLPEPYRELAVSEARLRSPEAVAAGRALFLHHCSPCHGAEGDGRGPRAAHLGTAPADLREIADRRPRRLFSVLDRGVPGTDMPAWRALSAGQRWDLVAFLRGVDRTPAAARGRGGEATR